MKINLGKGELKSKLKFLVLDHNPEIEVTQGVWDEVYHFYIGYSQCFSDVVKFPIDQSYAINFILEETFNHLLKLIKS